MEPSTMDKSALPYRPCVGLMLANRDGLVFVGRRIDRPNSEPDAWQMPQGGIDPGEDETAAALRELGEGNGPRRPPCRHHRPLGGGICLRPARRAGRQDLGRALSRTDPALVPAALQGRGPGHRYRRASSGRIRRLAVGARRAAGRPHRALQEGALSQGRRRVPIPALTTPKRRFRWLTCRNNLRPELR